MKEVRVFMKTMPPVRRFSESFKRQVVKEYERGFLNKEQLQKKYSIGGNSVILEWCRKYGKLAYYSPTTTGRPMKDPQKQRIKELEKKLKAAELKIKVYDKLIEISKRDMSEDLLKKIEAKLSESWQQIKE